MSTEVADGNDAGFRQWGRPKDTSKWPKVEVDKLAHVREMEHLIAWLKSDVWGHSTPGQQRRINAIRTELDGLESLVNERPEQD